MDLETSNIISTPLLRSGYLTVCLFICLSVYLPVYLSNGILSTVSVLLCV